MSGPVLLSVDTCGHRLLRSRPPWTPSSTARACALYSFVTSRGISAAPHWFVQRRPASTATQDAQVSLDGRSFLQHLESHYSDDLLPRRTWSNGNETGTSGTVPVTQLMDGLNSSFRKLVDAIQQQDVRKALIYLRQVVELHPTDLKAGIDTLPRPFFTQVFQVLDPFILSNTYDPTAGVHISRGMHLRLNLEGTVDEWGVRKLYSRLLDRLLLLAEALRMGGYKLNNDEIHCLLRCAGAAAETSTARQIWNSMATARIQQSRNAATYTEFVRAKFLTEPLYNGWNKTQRVVVPRNLHRSRLLLSATRVRKLDRLRYKSALSQGLLGANKAVNHIEHQMRTMRKVGPATKLWRQVNYRGYLTEDLTCAFITAFGRAGALRTITQDILMDVYGLSIDHPILWPNSPQIEEEVLAKKAKGRPSKKHIPTEQPRQVLRPTERLMDAIVEAFGSNGEITVALQLVEKIAREHDITIPTRVWTDLLEWTHIMSSRPQSTMWTIAGLESKIPTSHAIDIIWQKLRASDPMKEPDFQQLIIMAQAYLGRGRRGDAYAFMEAALALYRVTCEEYKHLGLEYTQSLRDGALSNSTIHRYECARFQKQSQWYQIYKLCRKFLTKFRPLPRIDNDLTERFIPNFIQKFREFVPNPASYRTATGHLFLVDPATELLQHVLVGHRTLDIAYRGQRQDSAKVKAVTRRKLLMLSRRSLEGQWSTKLKAQRLLRDVRPSFRMTGAFAAVQRQTSRRARGVVETAVNDDE